jgi:hypothetical protein
VKKAKKTTTKQKQNKKPPKYTSNHIQRQSERKRIYNETNLDLKRSDNTTIFRLTKKVLKSRLNTGFLTNKENALTINSVNIKY